MGKKKIGGHPFEVEDREPLEVDRREVDVSDIIISELQQIPIPEGFYIFSVLPRPTVLKDE